MGILCVLLLILALVAGIGAILRVVGVPFPGNVSTAGLVGIAVAAGVLYVVLC